MVDIAKLDVMSDWVCDIYVIIEKLSFWKIRERNQSIDGVKIGSRPRHFHKIYILGNKGFYNWKS